MITDTNDLVFKLGVTVKLVSGFHRLARGRYRLTLGLVGPNFDAQRWRLVLGYDGKMARGELAEDHLSMPELRKAERS
jgi:hypothetical protein